MSFYLFVYLKHFELSCAIQINLPRLAFRELTSSMCWSAWPDTAWRRCRTPSYPDILPVDTKRCLRSLTDLMQKHHLHFLGELTLTTFTSVLQVVTPVVWNKPDVENSVPLWIIILAILAGLLLLALLIYVLYKVSALKFRSFFCDVILSVLIFNSRFVFCSSASSNDLYLTAPPWRKHNSSHRLPLRPRRPPALPEPQYLAIWLQ